MFKRLGVFMAAFFAGIVPFRAAVVGETLLVAAESPLPMGARYFRPAGAGPFPAVVVMHGSGGLWANDNPAGNVMTAHFEDWAQDFANEGYASLFVDSYTPRGIVEFGSRRPAENPSIDDSACSPAYERPKDTFKALAFLQARPEIIPDRIGLLGFSQGAETALASVVSTGLVKASWTMSYLKLDESTESRPFPEPPRIQVGPGFAVAVAYYPGCGFYGYFGSPNSAAAGLYMPYAPTLIQHGSADPLYASDLYPEKFKLKAQAEANARGLNFNPLELTVYGGATHSFDETVLGMDPSLDTPNQAARRAARQVTLGWFAAYLKLPEVQMRREPNGSLNLVWKAGVGVTYKPFRGSSPDAIVDLLGTSQPSATPLEYAFPVSAEVPFQFFRLQATRPGLF